VIRAITAQYPGSLLIALSAYGGDEDVYQALQVGARGYLMKDIFREQLLEAIRNVSAGKRYLPQMVANSLAERIDRPELTSREKQVLELIAQAFSNKQIAADLGLSEGTVKGHVNSILSKLGVEDRTHATLVALKRGLARL
jgi:DNA-binding NarL/FixJ family response regulator